VSVSVDDALLLPAATEGLVKLDQGNEFIRLGLGQPQFSGKGIRLCAG
jgi:hypothetical protein